MKPKQKKKKDVTLNDLALMMGRGFNEVHEKMDNGFQRVDERFEQVDRRFDDVYEKLEEVHEKIDNVHTELKHDFNTLQTAVDGYAKKSDTYFQEMVMLAHKVDRMERWILQLAEKIGIQLKA
ncbi:MAG: hypothetical protein NUV61_00510 [Candidatus Azambacteria bacterium]|nr:hypothetical protein [Candidatus Azambacteria bacterium]